MAKRDNDKNNFFYPHSTYRGQVKPENVVFNANLQEFAQRVNYICNLETGGKVAPDQAYKQIRELWHQLTQSREQLRIGENPFQSEEEL
ncbi:MAG: hypothetical protein SAJ37_22695 [Oscillatoria sp. PMC 1068.18]|nr:hypothetical protein [Oscillatoria sp. PMC 1076.18]MEC4991554.1 hypothetical protein [Oscillatoria sp. PMC 1068.18]